MKTFQEFLTEGKIKRAKKEFKKAIKAYKNAKKEQHNYNTALSKPTEPGSEERIQQLKVLNRQQGREAGKIFKKREEILKRLHTSFGKAMSRMDGKPKKQQKFSDKVKRKMEKIGRKYDTSPNTPMSGTD